MRVLELVLPMEELNQILGAADETGASAKGPSRVHGDCEESSPISRWPEVVAVLGGHHVGFLFM
jgi:hypothetical protein